MPYYKEINLLFIHIPKTGGTTIEQNLKKKNKQRLYSNKTNKILPPPFNNISLQHQTYTTIYTYMDVLDVSFNDTLKIITIVRNPYNRIISDLFWQKLINTKASQNEIYDIMTEYITKTSYDNHNIPQYKFITDTDGKIIQNIKIFKTETLTGDLQEYGMEYGITDYNIPQKNKDYMNYLNNDSIELINKYYAKDFELFGYKMITTDNNDKNGI